MRPGWDHYFMGFAHQASSRATCSRKRVGAVLVASRQVVATGYNGALSGMPHCDDPLVGHDMVSGHCVRTVHAEANALAQAAANGVPIKGAVCYSTASPCWDCFRLLVQAGVTRFVYAEPYRSDDTFARIQDVIDTTYRKTARWISAEELPPLIYTGQLLTKQELEELMEEARGKITHPDGVGDPPVSINPAGLMHLIDMALKHV